MTFRLAGSLPKSLLKDINWEKNDILKTADYVGRGLSPSEKDHLEELHFEEVDFYLRNSTNSRWLANEKVAQVVIDALQYFDGKRYQLFAWAIMPNHIHVIVQPIDSWELSSIVHSWKSFTANTANKILNRKGTFWQSEYYDHLIRNEDDLHRCIDYTWRNTEMNDRRWKYDVVHNGYPARPLAGMPMPHLPE